MDFGKKIRSIILRIRSYHPSLLINDHAIAIRIKEKNRLTSFDVLSELECSQSVTNVDERLLILELIVDIAADRTPATKKPLRPIGSASTIKCAYSRSGSITTPL